MKTRNLTLMTDLYELTMMQGYFKENNNETVVFDIFYRNNPCGSGYAIAAGLEQIIDYIQNLQFTYHDISYLRSLGIFDTDFLEYLRGFHFSGNLYAIPEGTVVFPNEPLIKIVAPIMEAQLIETAMLNIINHQSLIATKASRVVWAAEGDGIMEFGLRRAQGPDAGIYGARAAMIGGCIGTCILLVDTYDTLRTGVPHAIQVFQEMRDAGIPLTFYGIRLDSGDLAYLSKQARRMLDEAGFSDAVISASCDLDEYLIASLKDQGATITSWGVGTNMITSKDCPSFGGVYKLAAIWDDEKKEFIPKIKKSENSEKITNPGNKVIHRIYLKETGKIVGDLIALEDETFSESEDLMIFDPTYTWKKTLLAADTYTLREILVPVFQDGICVYQSPSVTEIQEYCRKELNTLWDETRRFINPHKVYVDLSAKLHTIKNELLGSI